MKSFFISCFGSIVFVFIEYVIVDAPKSPAKRGMSGWFMLRFSEAIPRNPESIKIVVAFILLCLSLYIKRMAVQISIKPIIFCMVGKIFGIIKIKSGMIIMRDDVAIVDPISVNCSALCPSPRRSSSCPGNVERAVSSDGAPRKIEGIKSTKVCVIAIEIIKTTKRFGGILLVIAKGMIITATKSM